LVGAYQVNNCFMNKNISTWTFYGKGIELSAVEDPCS
jgi:hypothetical protein